MDSGYLLLPPLLSAEGLDCHQEEMEVHFALQELRVPQCQAVAMQAGLLDHRETHEGGEFLWDRE